MGSQQVFLDVDIRPVAMQKIYGYRDDQLLVLAQPLISHGGERIEALFTRFVNNLLQNRRRLVELSETEARAVIAAAATSAMDADPDLTAERNGGLSFVLACRGAATSAPWRLCLLGAYYVLHFVGGGAKEILVPHSVYREAMAKGVPRSMAQDFAGASTLGAVPGRRFDADIRIAEVQLAGGEALLALPEPRRRIEPGERVEAPMDLSAIREIAGRLRSERGHLIPDQAMLSRSLFAIVCAESTA